MANELIVNKLISTFGFKYDEKSFATVQRQIDKLKQRLLGVEGKYQKDVESAEKRRNKKSYDSHVELLDKKLRAEAKSLRRLRQLEKSESVKRMRAGGAALSGRATRVKGNVQQYIDTNLVAAKNPDLVRTAKMYRDEEIATRKDIARLEREAYKEEAARKKALHRQQVKAARDAEAAIKRQAALERQKYTESRKAFREKMQNLSEEIRINRRVNRLQAVRAEYARDKLIAQDKLNRGVLTQAQYEERINQIINRRRSMARTMRESGGASGMGGAGLAGGAGIITGARKFGSGIMPGLAAGGAAFGSVFAAQELFQGAVRIEQFLLAMNAVTGSTEQARKELEYFRDVARDTGVSLSSGLDSYKSFASAMVTSGQSIEQTRETYLQMSRAAMIYGLSQDQINGTLRAFGQVASKGQLYAEELRQQLGERLYGAVKLTADGLGVTVEELNKMMERGEIDANRFFPAITESLKTLADQAGDTGDTLPKVWSDLKNVFADISFQLEQLGANDALKEILKNITELARGFLKIIVPAISIFILTLKELTDVIGSEATGLILAFILLMKPISMLVTTLLAIKKSAGVAAAAMRIFWASAMGPVTAVVLGIALLSDELEKAFSGNEKKSFIDIWLRDPLNKWLSDLIGTDTKIFNLLLGSMPTLVVGAMDIVKGVFEKIPQWAEVAGDAIKGIFTGVTDWVSLQIESMFNGFVEKWNWLKSKIPFMDDEGSSDGDTKSPTERKKMPSVGILGTTVSDIKAAVAPVAKKATTIKEASDERPVWDEAGGQSYQDYQNKLRSWELFNKGRQQLSDAQKYGVKQADGSMFYSKAIAEKGQAGLEFMQRMGTDPEKLALARKQLEQQGGQPVVNQNIGITVNGAQNPEETGRAIKKELEKITGAGVQATPAGYN